MSTNPTQKRYPEEFKIEAVRQITERGHKIADVAVRLGVSPWSLYQWRKQYGVQRVEYREAQDQVAENRRLKAELRRVTEERDILKKAAVSSTDRCNSCHELIRGGGKAQGFSRALVQSQSDSIEISL